LARGTQGKVFKPAQAPSSPEHLTSNTSILSSKPAGRRSPALGRFDSFAASSTL